MDPLKLAERRFEKARLAAGRARASYDKAVRELRARDIAYHDRVAENLGLGRHAKIPHDIPAEQRALIGEVMRRRKWYEKTVDELRLAAKERDRALAQSGARTENKRKRPRRHKAQVKQQYRGRRNEVKLRIARHIKDDVLAGMPEDEVLATAKQRMRDAQKRQERW